MGYILGLMFGAMVPFWIYLHVNYERGAPTGSLSLAYAWAFGIFALFCVGIELTGGPLAIMASP